MAAERVLRSAALRAARKALPIRGDRALNAALEFAAGDLAEAYRIGAEEAQGQIVARLRALPTEGRAEK
jgi:hypothetical protein